MYMVLRTAAAKSSNETSSNNIVVLQTQLIRSMMFFFYRKSTDNAKHRCDYRKRTVSRTLGAVTSRTERTREAKQQQQKMISQPLWTYYMCTMRKSGLRKRFISAFVQLLSSFPSSPTAGCFVYTIYRLFARSPTHTFDILFARAHSLHPCSIRAIQSRLFSSIFI